MIKGDPKRTTRGLLEGSIVELPNNDVMLVMRGSNQKKPHLRSYRWISSSKDGGETWSKAKPWTYDDNKPFFSPSSCSQLLKHSSGRIFWMGNISTKNPDSNSPRYPLVIGEVDNLSMCLIRKTVIKIDDHKKGDLKKLTLSNFYAREDRETKDILLHCTALWRGKNTAVIKKLKRKPTNNEICWTGDAIMYRIKIK